MNDTLGNHLFVELSGCDIDHINDLDYLDKVLSEAITLSGATILTKSSHRFSPQGISMLFMLAESHLSIHTWPERGYASIDMYTCGNSDPIKACQHLIETLKARHYQYTHYQRGLLSDKGYYVHRIFGSELE